jgi:hypothetical protein
MTISFRRLLSKLTALAIAGAPTAGANAAVNSTDTDRNECADKGTSSHEHLDAHAVSHEHLDGRVLAHAIAEMSPLAATHLATTWALSDDPLRRGAIAHALEWSFPLFGDGAVIEHLSQDPDPTIRAACARAAWARRTAGGDHGVLDRLAHDPDPDVRAIASRAR